MSGVSEAIVREYFELLGFVVSQPCKYTVPGRHKKAEEELDLLVRNPVLDEKDQRLPGSILWTTTDLSGIACAAVAVWGWHTERFSAATFEQTPELLRFVEDAAVRTARKLLGSQNVAKILCLAELPASRDLRKKALVMLKERGVDGVILFRTILEHIIAKVDRSKNYEKSDLLQVFRILKSYDLVKDNQMDFFDKKYGKRKPKQPA